MNGDMALSVTDEERLLYTGIYEDILRNQMLMALDYIETHQMDALIIKDRFDDFLILLDQAQRYPILSDLFVDITSALCSWIQHWGYWGDWQRHLYFAVEICEVSGDKVTQAIFWDQLADIAFNTGNLNEALATRKKIIKVARRNNLSLLLAKSAASLSEIYFSMELPNEAEDLVDQLLQDEMILSDDNPLCLATLELAKASLLRTKGLITKAVECAGRAVAYLEDDPSVNLSDLAYTYKDRGLVHWAHGDYDAARNDFLAAVDLFGQEGLIFPQAFANSNLGLLYWSACQLDLAEDVISKAIKVFSELNARKHLTSSIGNLGLVYLSRGQLTEAFYYISKQLEDAQALGIEREAFRAIGNRGIVRFYLGEYEAALSDVGSEQRLERLKRRASKEAACLTNSYLSRIYDKLGQKDQALEYSERASAIAHDSTSLALDIVTLRCAAHHQSGQEQLDTLQRALALSLGKRPLDEASCLLFLSALEHNANKRTNLWNNAKAILDQIGAHYWLQNLTPDDAIPQMPLLI